ncbi:AraC family transcriptional regulator [Prevotella sp. 10(H)]|uniref:helix-turn-helix domain-containing protein n=1 Tax=Prevotella sp. 10(H) TaxID=1158294 RepID=UPI0004A6CFAD|nr:helix-turn-helix domain-containing protein [Prevotella sp. 10(H)]
MDNNEISLQIDIFINYYKEYNLPHIDKKFILFDNPHNSESYHMKYINKDGLLISFIKEGGIEIQINYQKYYVKAPAIVSISQNAAFEYYRESEDAKINSIYISSSYINSFYFLPNIEFLWQAALNPVLMISDHKMYYIQSYIRHLRELYKLKDSPLHALIINTMLYVLITEIISGYSSQFSLKESKSEEHKENITFRFTQLLTHIRPVQRGVAFYAEKLNISSYYLSVSVKNVTGHPAIEWINNTIIMEAKKMLRFTDFPIHQISEELGFQSPAYFASFFKKKEGLTPLSYRKRQAELIILPQISGTDDTGYKIKADTES